MIAVPRDQVKTEASVAMLPIPVPLVTVLRGHRKRQSEERFAAARHRPGLHNRAWRLRRTPQRQSHVPSPVRDRERAAAAGAQPLDLVGRLRRTAHMHRERDGLDRLSPGGYEACAPRAANRKRWKTVV